MIPYTLFNPKPFIFIISSNNAKMTEKLKVEFQPAQKNIKSFDRNPNFTFLKLTDII